MPKEGATASFPTDDSSQKETVVVHVPRVTPRTLPGPANTLNKGAIDWGGHGLLAFGSNYTVVVVDTKNVQIVQCLDRHKAMVKKVLWGRDYLSQDKPSLHPPRVNGSIDLVSSDMTGHIVVWDITYAQPTAILQDGTKPVVDMKWVNQYDGNNHVLAALHPPYSLILWDTRSGTKLWKKTYTETLLSFDFDPFHPAKMAFHCSDCILFVEDFSVSRIPSSNGRKFYVSSPRPSASGSRGSTTNLAANKGSIGNLTVAVQEERSGAKDRFRRLMKDMVIGEIKPKAEDGMTLNECVQVMYHRSLRHHILLLYPREVLLLDLHINQTVGIVPLNDKAASPFLQVVSCKQRDVLYCLHESGSVSIKIRRKPSMACSPIDAPAPSIASLEMNSEVQLEIAYDHKCSSEPVRQTRGLQILGISLNPVCERRIALYLNSGKIVFLEVLAINNEANIQLLGLESLSTPKQTQKRDTLNEIMPPLLSEINHQPPALRLLVTGLLPSTAAPLTTIRMCPAITTKNWQQYAPLLAGGTTGGMVQIYNVATGNIEKELIIHSYTVRGIEWTGLKTFLSYAYPNSSGTSLNVRNEISITDVLTGKSVPIRTDRGEEAPIDILRVSPLKQYFVLVLNGGPLELWDLKSRTMLHSMPKKFPIVTALEWSPVHNNPKSLKRRQSSKEECLLDTTVPPAGGNTNERKDSVDNTPQTEYVVFSDSDSTLYHFTVVGHLFKDATKIPPENDFFDKKTTTEQQFPRTSTFDSLDTFPTLFLIQSGTGTVTCIAYKADQIVQGDADGMLSIWNLRISEAKRHTTSRGCVKKIRFAPGKGNLKLLVLYNDGVDVIDIKGEKGFEKIAQLKCPRDMVKVLDVDWAASDKPILATQDGCLRITDMSLKSSSSPILDYEFHDPMYCLAMLPSEVAFKVRERLCWQPADAPYSTEHVDHGFTENQVSMIRSQLSMVDEERLECLRNPQFKTAERCLIVAQLFGDQAEIDFWTVALYYLQFSKAKANSIESVADRSEGSLNSPTSLGCKKFNNYPHLTPLDTCYDVLQDPYTYQRLQLERVALHESRRSDYEHTKRVIQQLILLGQSDRAVQLLLETDLNNPEYYTDAIKACLVATVQSTQTAQSTMKLVATNLIAHGTIWEGVQLLCLIGKGLDACRYLASYSHWGAASWLARAVLPSCDAHEVIRKWADYLSSLGQKEKAVLILISLEHWNAAHSLLSVIDPRRASLLAQACRDFEINLL